MPSTDNLVVEVIKFKADGLTEVAAQTKAYSKDVTETNTRLKTMAALMNDPRYERYRRVVGGIADATELLGAKMRNSALAARIADGSFQRTARAMADLNKQHDRMQRLATPKPGGRAFLGDVRDLRQRQQLLERGMRDGSYSILRRRREEYEAMAQKAELIARYGDRAGGFLARHGSALSAAGKVGTFVGGAALATGGGLVHRGFQGTVEAARANQELTMLSRELAGAFKPLIEFVTKGARRVREWMEALGTGGQNAVLAGGIGLSGLMAARALGVGGRFLAGAAGIAGVVGEGAAAVGGVGGATAAAAARSAGGVSRLGRVGRFAGKAAIPLAIGTGIYDATTGGFYEELRARGDNKFQAGIGAAGGAVADFFSFGAYGDEFRKRMGSGTGPWSTQEQLNEFRARTGDRRRVAVSQGGFDDPESGYDRLNIAISKLEAEREVDPAAKDREEGNRLLGLILTAINGARDANPRAFERPTQ